MGTRPLILAAIMVMGIQAHALESMGEPEPLFFQIMQESGELEALQTENGVVPHFDELSDEQIYQIYGEQWQWTQDVLDSVLFTPEGPIFGLVSTMASKNKSSRNTSLSSVTCLAMGIHGEARGEPMSGKLAVGETLMIRAGGKSNRICAALFARGQFESARKNRGFSAEAMRAAKATLAKKISSCGFDYFYNKKLQKQLKRRTPDWVLNFERRGCAQKKVGLHTFYSSCKCGKKKRSA